MTRQDHAGPTHKKMARALPPILITGVMLFLLLSSDAATTPLQAAPDADALVRVDPAVVITTTGAISVPVDIRIENVNGLYGADVQVAFDPALVAVEDADPGKAGVQIGLGPLLTSGAYYVVINTANNVSGTIRLALIQLNPTLPITGSGVLARFTFKPVGQNGVSPIHFTQVELADRNGSAIPATTQDGVIDIQAETPRHYLYLPLIMSNH